MGGATPTPLGVSNVSIEELSRKNQRIALYEYSRLVVRFFYPRSTHDRVLRGQRPNFPESAIFHIYLQVHIFKTIQHIKMKPFSSYSTLNSEQDETLFWHLDQIFMMYSIPEGSDFTLTGQIARGQAWRKALIDI